MAPRTLQTSGALRPDGAPASAPRAPDGGGPQYLSHRQILVVLIGLMAGMLLAALDQSIVGTAQALGQVMDLFWRKGYEATWLAEARKGGRERRTRVRPCSFGSMVWPAPMVVLCLRGA
jgi:hypothetical protein